MPITNLPSAYPTKGTRSNATKADRAYLDALNTSKQDNLTLTTTGSSGAATLTGATLNVPQYTGGSGGGTWGSITGTLSAQADLSTALAGKQATITNSDSITQGSTNLFLTGAERTKLSTTSGTNTGDQTTITGNAGTATTLATSRAINGVNFNGSSAITIADSTKIPESTVTAKGDILAASASSTVTNLAVGSDGNVLTADSTQTAGVKWAAASGASTGIVGWYNTGDYSAFQGTDQIQIGGGGSSAAMLPNVLYAWRILPVENIKVNGAMVMVNTAGTGSDKARWGIYASDPAAGPIGAPIIDTGDQSVVFAAGTLLQPTFTSVQLYANTCYWAFIMTNSSTFLTRFMSGGSTSNTTPYAGLGTGIISGNAHAIRQVAATYGTPPTSPTTVYGGYTTKPGVFFQVSRT